MTEFLPLIGSVIAVIRSIGNDEQSPSPSSPNHNHSDVTTGLLCSIDPLGNHVMLLRIEALQDGTLQRRVTMLHRATFHTLEPLSPIPKLWQDYLATHQATAGNDKETVVDNNDAKRAAVLEEENRLCEATLVLLNTHGVVATVTNDTRSNVGHKDNREENHPSSKKIVAFGGALTIRGPKFNAAGCTSANPLILRRIRTLLENGCK